MVIIVISIIDLALLPLMYFLGKRYEEKRK